MVRCPPHCGLTAQGRSNYDTTNCLPCQSAFAAFPPDSCRRRRSPVGTAAASENTRSLPLTAFLLGFAGISIWCQILSVGKSIKINLPYTFRETIEDNSLGVSKKSLSEKRIPERSDPRTFGGGYGVCGPWLDLLLNLTFLYESHTLEYSDYINYLRIKRILTQKGYANSKGGQLPFLEGANYRIMINEDIFSPYHKYCIANNLEQIRDEELLLPQSRLAKNFKQETKAIISAYEKTREKILKKMDHEYKKYL